MSSKRYTEEFKIEAIRQVVDRGYSIAEVADRLGTTTHSLYSWKKKYGPDSTEHLDKAETTQRSVTSRRGPGLPNRVITHTP